MGKTLYVFSSATLKRKDNTLMLQTKTHGTSYLPVETVDEILVMGEAEINKSLLGLLSGKGIVLHFFDHFGKYTGTYSPPESRNSGQVFLAQAAHWLDERKRHELAAAFVIGAIGNMIRLIKYYGRRHEHIDAGEILGYLKQCLAQAPDTPDVQALMGIEGAARNMYYKFFDMMITDQDFRIGKRVRRPPNNIMNAMISFVNSLCYSAVLTQIYHTHLDPRISFLHSPSDRRISLNLDISEIFKPVLADRLIFSLVNRKMIKSSGFEQAGEGIYASENARRIIITEWEKSLRGVITYPSEGHKMGWRRIIRTEALNVQKYITEGLPYEPFIHRW
ncbi:MAG: type I-B CRISPR-associated endonuclease Cas1 [Synergistaceae bacterium]|nr:type I-B CRISPR-associated endonuclease Cas1 [Synergistaceae bacterium]